MLVVFIEGTVRCCEEPSAFFSLWRLQNIYCVFVEFVCCAHGYSFCHVYPIFNDLWICKLWYIL